MKMQLGVISDTHGHVNFACDAVRMLEAFHVEQVLHCGDIGSGEIPILFSQWPTHYVLGNIDQEVAELHQAIRSAKGIFHGAMGSLCLEGCRVAVMHGHQNDQLDEAIKRGKWDLVCSGHTHVPECRKVGRTTVLNPGALFRARQHTIAIVGCRRVK